MALAHAEQHQATSLMIWHESLYACLCMLCQLANNVQLFEPCQFVG